jgi:hypothetical protein
MGPLDRVRALHERLDQHFRDLRNARDQRGGRSVFALEHGLNTVERDDLQARVRELIKSREPGGRWWLPIVVYAAEVGYRYKGEEYWQTFENETPGWTAVGDRDYVRESFRLFAKGYGGAEPSGRWASQFSIISWPITHAVLPTDLQFHLARILYEYSNQLTPELVSNPELLGARLASRTAGTSSRFVNFAQNSDLIGQVAAALLSEAEERSPLLLNSTLERIVADLGEVRKARVWLHEAQTSVIRNRVKGMARVGFSYGAGRGQRAYQHEHLAPLSLSLNLDEAGAWTASIDLPDFEVLRRISVDLYTALGRLRCKVTGIIGPPIAQGRVMFAPHLILDSWPRANEPLLQLENADAALNAVLAEECSLSPGPPWLFKVGGSETAAEVLGKTVRPGGVYILVTDSNLEDRHSEWITPASIKCNGVEAWELRVPQSVGQDELGLLRDLHLSVLADIEVRPVGIVPAAWDGEGWAEWIGGDQPVIAISSNREIRSCVVALDDDAPQSLPWPGPTTQRLYLRLTALEIGRHRIQASLVPASGALAAIDGTLEIDVREPRVRAPSGSFREALMILSSPASPTLGEFWEGKVKISILGPVGLPVDARVTLEGRPGNSINSKQIRGLRLPIASEAFAAALDEQFRTDEAARIYDDATACRVEISNPDLGSASLRCEREFAPLRWGVGRDRDGPYVRLHDNVGARDLKVERIAYARPDVREIVQIDLDSKLRSTEGGLFLATWQEFRAAVVLPPSVRDFNSLRLANVKPWIASSGRLPETILKWVDLSAVWATARLPGDAFARHARDNVLRALVISICSVIGGSRWAAAEQRLANGNPAIILELSRALNDNDYQGIIAADVRRRATGFAVLSLEERVRECARYLRKIAPNMRPGVPPEWYSEFMLRLASSPAQMSPWAGPLVQVGVDMALEHPMMLRIARYMVLAVQDSIEKPVGASLYEGWVWD